MGTMPELFKTPTKKDFKKIKYCNKRKCYEIYFNKKRKFFFVDGLSSYWFYLDGRCLNWKTLSDISSGGMEGKFILTSDYGKRTTIRINGIINHILEDSCRKKSS